MDTTKNKRDNSSVYKLKFTNDVTSIFKEKKTPTFK